MTPLDAFYNTVHDADGGPEALAARLGMSAQVLRNKANPNNSANKPLLDDADRVMGLTGDFRILEALAASHRRVCIEIPEDGDACDLAILELVTHVWQRNGDVGAAVHQTLADGKVEKQEIARVRQAVYKTQQALNEMLMRLEGMAEK